MDGRRIVEGCVTCGDNTPVAGSRVVARGADGEIVGVGATDAQGLFHIPLPQKRGGVTDVRVELLDGPRSADWAEVMASIDGPVIDLRVPTDLRDRIMPAEDAFPRLSGPIYDPDAWQLVQAAVAQLAPEGGAAFNVLINAARCPGPPIYAFEDLLDVASAAITGSVAAQLILAARLERFAEADARYEPILVDVARSALAGGRMPFRSDAARPMRVTRLRSALPDGPAGPRPAPDTPTLRCVVPRDRWLTLMGGVAAAAQGPDHLLTLSRGLELGFCGYGQVQRLVDMAVVLLQEGVEAPLREALLTMECGPDDGPVPGGWSPRKPFPTPERDPPFELPDPECSPPLECWHDLVQSVRTAFATGAPYRITSLSPPRSCAGARIVIEGQNFGLNGVVCFGDGSGSVVAPGAPAGRCVRAAHWSDTRIEVDVPPGGFSLFVSLSIIERTDWVCDKFITVYRKGNRVAFDGGSAAGTIALPAGRCVAPGEQVPIRWRSHPPEATRTLEVVLDGNVVRSDAVAASGTTTWTVPDVAQPVDVDVVLRIDGPCDAAETRRSFRIDVAPTLAIDGVEVTQGIQTYDRTDGTADNTLSTIAGKDTIVRVYIDADRKGAFGDRVPDVTGELIVDGVHRLMPINGEAPDSCGGWSSGNPFIEARQTSAIDRQITDHTLNFRIPRALCSGTRDIKVEIVGPEICGKVARDTFRTTWSWRAEAALPVRYVRVRDAHPTTGTNQRPTDAEAMCTLRRGLDLLPTPADDLGPAARPIFDTARDRGTSPDSSLSAFSSGLTQDLDDLHACRTTEWLWGLFRRTVCPAEHDVIWVGMTTPFQNGNGLVPGKTSTTTIVDPTTHGATTTRRVKTAHEIGHNLGYSHVPLGGAGGTLDPNMPNGGLLIDVAFDPFYNRTVPTPTNDIMAYGRRWISGYHWDRFQTILA